MCICEDIEFFWYTHETYTKMANVEHTKMTNVEHLNPYQYQQIRWNKDEYYF